MADIYQERKDDEERKRAAEWDTEAESRAWYDGEDPASGRGDELLRKLVDTGPPFEGNALVRVGM